MNLPGVITSSISNHNTRTASSQPPFFSIQAATGALGEGQPVGPAAVDSLCGRHGPRVEQLGARCGRRGPGDTTAAPAPRPAAAVRALQSRVRRPRVALTLAVQVATNVV